MKIGIDLGGSHIGIGIVEQENIIDQIERVFYAEEKAKLQQRLVPLIMECLENLLLKNEIKWEEVEQIGIAVPGEIQNGKPITLTNLPIKNFDLEAEMQTKWKEKTDQRVIIKIKNDAKCAAIAEKLYGSMQGYEDGIFLCLGTGIGGAAFLGGNLLEPINASGMEFGHMVIEKNGKECNCGKKGCFEKYAAMRVLKNAAKKLLDLPDDISNEAVKNALLEHQEEKEIQELIENYLEKLAIGIANLITIFEPQVICIGGGFAHFSDLLLGKLERKIKEETIIGMGRKSVSIKTAKLGNDAGIVGAANLT